jgi:hypothetical protein
LAWCDFVDNNSHFPCLTQTTSNSQTTHNQETSKQKHFYTIKQTKHESEEELTFKPGVERLAVTFIIQVPQLEVSAVHETTVRCDHILSPQQARVSVAGFDLIKRTDQV